MDTPEWKIEAFSWLPVERWEVATIFAYYEIKGKRYCKICDKWVKSKSLERHIKGHVKELEAINLRKQIEALKAREEAKRLRAEERKLAKEAA